MANICNFDMHIELNDTFGAAECCDFLSHIASNYGVFDFDLNDLYKNIVNENLNVVYVYGWCKWSVYSSFGPAMMNYAQSHNINFELFSAEPGMGFAEYYTQNADRDGWAADYHEREIGDDEYEIECEYWNNETQDWKWSLI